MWCQEVGLLMWLHCCHCFSSLRLRKKEAKKLSLRSGSFAKVFDLCFGEAHVHQPFFALGLLQLPNSDRPLSSWCSCNFSLGTTAFASLLESCFTRLWGEDPVYSEPEEDEVGTFASRVFDKLFRYMGYPDGSLHIHNEDDIGSFLFFLLKNLKTDDMCWCFSWLRSALLSEPWA